MGENAVYRLDDTAIIGVEKIEPPEVVTTDEIDARLAPTYERLGLVPGTIERLAGVRERRWWTDDFDYVEGSVQAARAVLDSTGIDPARIGLVVNASVSRPHLEPAVAARVHHELGLPRSAAAFDVTNACLGVMNAIQMAGAMIDTGQIEYALVVASEGVRAGQEATIERLLHEDATKDDVKFAFATFTLGCGAVALVLGRASQHPDAHRVVGGVTRAGTEHHELCIGSMDGMRTDGRALFEAGIRLAIDTYRDAAQDGFEWADMDSYVAHQTSVAHVDAISQALGLARDRFPMSLPTYGNIGPVALPFTLALAQSDYRKGDRVLLMGIGSGLNTAFTEVEW